MQNQSGDKTREMQLSVREALSSKKEEPQKDSESEFSNLDHSDDDEASFDSRMRQQILRRRKELGDVPPKQKIHNGTFIIYSILQIYRCSILNPGLYHHPQK